MQPETGNIRSALSWGLEHDPAEAARLAASLDAYWVFQRDLAEGRAWLERALAAGTQLPADIQARALWAAGWLAKDQSDLAQAEAWLVGAAERARPVGEQRVLAKALMLLAEVVVQSHGDVTRARQVFDEARAAAEAVGEPLLLAHAALIWGGLFAGMGDLPVAQQMLEEALVAHQRSGGAMGRAMVEEYLGGVLLARGDPTGAARRFRHALLGFADLRAWGHVAGALEGFAGATVDRQPAAAARLLGAAAALRERILVPRKPVEAVAFERAESGARSRLDAPTFAATSEAGRDLTWDAVLAEVDALAGREQGEGTPLPGQSYGLSPREREVLSLLAEGRSNRAIAETLSLSERTVEHHVLHILTKLGLESRTAAATFAVRNGLA
jgi:DNA-binding CsgD family transcriptional regulator